jgi:quinol monooxygenase YgiN
MSVMVTIHVQAQPGKAEAVKDFLRKVLPDTRVREGCESVTIHQNQDDPARLMFCGQWATRPHYESYLAWRTETGALADLGALVIGDPVWTFYDYVGA